MVLMLLLEVVVLRLSCLRHWLVLLRGWRWPIYGERGVVHGLEGEARQRQRGWLEDDFGNITHSITKGSRKPSRP